MYEVEKSPELGSRLFRKVDRRTVRMVRDTALPKVRQIVIPARTQAASEINGPETAQRFAASAFVAKRFRGRV